MLKQRLITAAILVPLLLAVILYADVRVLLGLLLFVLGLAAYEWQGLIPVDNRVKQMIFWGALGGASLFCWLCFPVWLVVGIILWGLVIAAVVTYPASQRIWGRAWVVALWGCVCLPLMAISAIKLYQQPHGAGLIIYVFALVSVADSGAYFVGKFLGRHALIPKVSAGKTIEGALGGLLLPMGVAAIGVWLWAPSSYVTWFGLALVTTVISMFGDLVISMLKRRQKLKDTGALLPGHGGVLDRTDSVIAALPCFYLGFYYSSLVLS
jgi:phosphatidate cytidylyltransferase